MDVFEPYNANIIQPMDKLRGEKVESTTEVPKVRVETSGPQQIRLVRPWEAVARDGREYAENGAGMMYWFKVPLGGICYPEGFRSFLAPALANPRISKIRFVLDSSYPIYEKIWSTLVLPLLVTWAESSGRSFEIDQRDDGGRFYESSSLKCVEWVHVDLSDVFSPCFKLLVDDPDNDIEVMSEAQIFLSTANRNGGIFKKCVNSQAVYPLSEQDGLKAQERRYTAYGKEKH